MKQVELLRAIYNDKEVLKKIRKSIDEYALNQKSMEEASLGLCYSIKVCYTIAQ